MRLMLGHVIVVTCNLSLGSYIKVCGYIVIEAKNIKLKNKKVKKKSLHPQRLVISFHVIAVIIFCSPDAAFLLLCETGNINRLF